MTSPDWWNDGSKSSDWAMAMLPILVRQARSQHPLTYGDLARELGMKHHRPVQKAAGWIAHALDEIGRLRGWTRRPPPPLQSLIVNKATRLPGEGADVFMTPAYRQARTNRQRAAALHSVHGSVYAYPHWDDVLRLLGVESAAGFDDLSEEATASRGQGGEGPEHRALKEFVATHPEIVGLSPSHAAGEPEQPLPSGDIVDVLFSTPSSRTVVEVKSHISGRGDLARGVYQCVKYRAVLEAHSGVIESSYDVTVVLVLGGPLPIEVMRLAHAFSVPVIQNVRPE